MGRHHRQAPRPRLLGGGRKALRPPLLRHRPHQGQCLEKIRALVARHQAGALSPPTRLTLGEWLRDWLGEGRNRWRPSTYRRREQALRPLLPHLGQVRLSRLSPLHLWRALSALSQEGIGRRTLELAYATLHAALDEARRLGLLSDNPMARIGRPKRAQREVRDWTAEEMRRFLAACLEDGSPLALMLAFMLLTGLRPSEALGLRWEDMDFEAGAVTVRRALVWAGREWHIVPPKSRAGERTVALPTMARAILGRLPRRLPWAFWQERPPSPQRMSETMGELCQRAAVPRRPAHYLRHCHATLLAAEGLDVKTLQRRLGHSQASITLDVYAHALSEMDRRAAELVDRALSPTA